MLASLLFVLSILALPDSGITCDRQKDRTSVIITLADHGRTFHLIKGQSLRVQLESTPSTGYAWHFLDFDDSMLELTGRFFRPISGSRPRGGASLEVTELRAKSAGRVVVEMAYYRIFEGIEHAENRLNFELIIEEGK